MDQGGEAVSCHLDRAWRPTRRASDIRGNDAMPRVLVYMALAWALFVPLRSDAHSRQPVLIPRHATQQFATRVASAQAATQGLQLRDTAPYDLYEAPTAQADHLARPIARPISPEPSQPMRWLLVIAAQTVLAFVVTLLIVYTVRHYLFSLNRLFVTQSAVYRSIVHGPWPSLTVFVAAHNEESVIVDCLEALLKTTYPHDRMTIIPVNDRSTDGTRALIDEVQARAPQLIRPFHRVSGKAGKAAALKDALLLMDGDILIVFDADYLPRPGLLKELVAPFFDPEVGAVMGRVVPHNADHNLLTRLLDLERAGGYQVNQQARMNLKLVPQYGGTVGGLRKSALDEVGGWRDDTLAEDTDMTYRLLLAGWQTVYLNHAECYEEVPERWAVRRRQLTRWAKGHNQTMFRCFVPLLLNRAVSLPRRLDGALLLGVYAMPALLLTGWIAALILYFCEAELLVFASSLVWLLALFSFNAFGNFGVFFEIVVATRLDGHGRRIRLMPLNAIGFGVTIASVLSALSGLALDSLFKRELHWDKTERFRKPSKAG